MQQRSVIRFFLNEGEKPTNIHARLRNMFGEETLKRTQVYHWISLFKSGRKTVSDLERCGRPTVVSEKIVREIQDIIEEGFVLST